MPRLSRHRRGPAGRPRVPGLQRHLPGTVRRGNDSARRWDGFVDSAQRWTTDNDWIFLWCILGLLGAAIVIQFLMIFSKGGQP